MPHVKTSRTRRSGTRAGVPGLGDEFQSAAEDVLRLIQADLLMYPRVHRLMRRVRVRRFPYAVYFLAERDRVVVLSVFHARRDPRV